VPDLTDVNTDDTVANVSLANEANGTDLQGVSQITVTDQNGNTLDGTNLVPSALQVLFDYGDMIANNIKFGVASLLATAADLRITQGGNFRVTQSGNSRITN